MKKKKAAVPKAATPASKKKVGAAGNQKWPQAFYVWELDEEWIEAVRKAEPPAIAKELDYLLDED